MAILNLRGYACFLGKDTDPRPALTAANVRFVPSDLPTQAACQAWFRLNPTAVSYPVSQVSNIQVETTAPGTTASTAEGRAPGTLATPETGTGFDGNPFVTDSAPLL
ncbi:hypothetical protein [Fibrella forsythiae]|uniref:Uncharacterized protein n=1 Tax=Fibrella forsythiae TaxID=2817061 RepID=A0ABS3JBV5_9BACT|nr:hypothetical protein [Fibrella forsythiae]MBO0947485.1 hypothetical protein [Fibrella forsythiae]